MQIVINIPEETVKWINDYAFFIKGFNGEKIGTIVDAITNGTPLLKGKWVNIKSRGECYLPCCSACGRTIDVNYGYNYCPNCGAKMEADG